MAKTSVILFADQSKSPNNRCLVGVYLTSYPDSTLLEMLRTKGCESAALRVVTESLKVQSAVI